MELCLFDHAEVKFLFSLSAIIRCLTMLFKNIQVIGKVVKKSSQFVAMSDMFCVITFFFHSVLKEQAISYGSFLVVSFLPTERLFAAIAGLQQNWVATCGIWPLIHICPFTLRHTFSTFEGGEEGRGVWRLFFSLILLRWLHLIFIVGTDRPLLARDQSSWSSTEGTCQAAGGKEMTWSRWHLFPKGHSSSQVACSPGHLVLARPNHAGCWVHWLSAPWVPWAETASGWPNNWHCL